MLEALQEDVVGQAGVWPGACRAARPLGRSAPSTQSLLLAVLLAILHATPYAGAGEHGAAAWVPAEVPGNGSGGGGFEGGASGGSPPAPAPLTSGGRAAASEAAAGGRAVDAGGGGEALAGGSGSEAAGGGAPGGGGGGVAGGAGAAGDGGSLLDDLPPSAATGPGPLALALLAVADAVYPRDHVAGTLRRDPGPCLAVWGARRGAAELRAPGDAQRRALVFATRRDVIVAFRGMAGGGSFRTYADVAPVYDSPYFGAPPPPARPPPELPPAAYRTRRPFADPELFWVLRRDYRVLRQLEGPLLEAISNETQHMPPAARARARVWLTGHSSGGALAQVAALRLAALMGVGRVGGVMLFNSDRVGSAGFARHYDALLGNRTSRFGYGLDNANLVSNMAMGLRFVGRGFWFCPAEGAASEAMVALPLGHDRVNACAGIIPFPRGADMETEDDVARRWRIPLWPYPVMSTFAEWGSFAHHFPALLFDAMSRHLGARGLPPAARAALRAPECVVSDRCSAALRPEGDASCRSCGGDETCTEYWGLPAGYRCDARPSWSRSALCFRPPPMLPFVVPPTLVGLLWGRASGGGAGAAFVAAAAAAAGRGKQ